MILNAKIGIISMIRTKIRWGNLNVKQIVNAMENVDALTVVAVDGQE